MLSVFEVTAPIFALIFAGFLAPKLKLLPDGGVAGINAFVFYFALPAMLFRVIAQQPLASFNSPRFMAAYALTGVLIFTYTLLISKPGHGFKQSIAFGLNSAHGNVGYLGVALVTELASHGGVNGTGLGTSILAPIVLTIICDVLVVIVLAIAFYEWVSHQERTQGQSSKGKGKLKLLLMVPLNILKSPLVFSILCGMTYAVAHEHAGLTLWPPLDTLVRILAAAAGPCALFAIGASLGNRKIDLSQEVIALSVMKLLVHPVIAAIMLFVVFRVDKLPAAIGVLAASLPAASNTFILAERYRAKSEPLAQAILLGTLMSVLSVSLCIWVLGLR
jgi:malonate transporter and related proteins